MSIKEFRVIRWNTYMALETQEEGDPASASALEGGHQQRPRPVSASQKATWVVQRAEGIPNQYCQGTTEK